MYERSEDEQRHHASLSVERKAYQERMVRAVDSVGYPARTVRAPVTSAFKTRLWS